MRARRRGEVVVVIRIRRTCALLALCLALPGFAQTELTVAFGAEATQMDPTRTSAGVDGYFLSLFFEQLLTVDPSLERINWLAEDWQFGEEDGRAFIDVNIRRGVKFHNGDELTAHDFRFSYLRQSDPKESLTAGNLRYVDDVLVIDDYRLRFLLNQPDGSLVTLNFELYAVPRKYFQEVGEEGFQAHPIGTGPWKFVSRKPREELVVERFDDYWNQASMPSIERLTIKIIPEDTTRVAAFKTGAVDWIDAVPPAQVSAFEAMEGVEVRSLPAPNNLLLHLNAVDPRSPLAHEKVRLALAHAIDVDAIIKYILYGQGIRTAQIAPGGIGYDPSLEPYPFDPDKTRELLAEAGFPRGFNINCYNLTTPREPYIKEMGEAVFAYLMAAGIRCRIVQLEYGAWINLGRRVARPEMDGIMSSMWGQGLPGDPAVAWSGHLHTTGDGWGTYSYHSDPELDAMIRTLRTTMDQSAREELIRNIARLKHERVAGGLPTYRPMITLAWRDTLEFNPWPSAFWRSMRDIHLRDPPRAADSEGR